MIHHVKKINDTFINLKTEILNFVALDTYDLNKAQKKRSFILMEGIAIIQTL